MRGRTVLAIVVIVLGLLVGALACRRMARSADDAGVVDARQRLSPFQRANVEWLLTNRLPCLGCHVINGQGGRLGPDLTDVGTRMSTDAIEQQLLNPQARTPASTMPPVPMPQQWRASLVLYLAKERSQGPTASPETASISARPVVSDPAVSDKKADPLEGALLYGRLCSACHGNSGQADAPNARNLPVAPTRHADSAHMGRRTDDWLFDVISRGGYPANRHPFMPPYGDLLRPGEIRSLVAHLRQLCACTAPEWSRDGQHRR